MESQREGVKEMIALLVHRCQVRADRAKGIGTVLGSEAAGNFLFYLRPAHHLLKKRAVSLITMFNFRRATTLKKLAKNIQKFVPDRHKPRHQKTKPHRFFAYTPI